MVNLFTEFEVQNLTYFKYISMTLNVQIYMVTGCFIVYNLSFWNQILPMTHVFVTPVYTDHSKAFDVVPHPKLFYKLSAYDICGNLLAWIKQLLTGRIQNTRVGNSLSESVPLGSGALHLFYSFCILTMLLL